jgi:RND family efflux transporter MFP subunit
MSPLPLATTLLLLVGTVLAQPRPATPPTTRGFDCLIEPRQTIELRSPVEGLIEDVKVERGQATRRGQVLVTLVSALERSNLEVARHRAEMTGRLELSRNRVDFARRKAERAQQLQEQNFISTQARDEAQTELSLAESEFKDALETQQQAQLELRRAIEIVEQRTLRSPFDGYVVERLLNPGDLAEAGTGRRPVLKLAQLDPLRVEVQLPAAAWGRVVAGSTVRVTVEGVGAPRTARVVVADKVIDAASSLFGVRLEMPNPGLKVPVGARCSAEFPGLGVEPVSPLAVPARN